MIHYKCPRRVLLIDEHPVCQLGIQRLFQDNPSITLAACATSLTDARLPVDIDLVILDLSTAKTKGVGAIRELRVRLPHAPVLVFTRHDEGLFAERCLKAGASGFLMKTALPATIVDAVETVAKGSLYVSEGVKNLMLGNLSKTSASERNRGFDRLSDRELLIVEQIGLSKNNKEIARELQISVKTIESHRSRIKAKLRLETPQELMRYAMRLHQS